MRLRVRPEALADLEGARAWYERRQRGLGRAMVRAVDDALMRVRSQPEAGVEVLPGVRRVLVRRFPYLVFYRLRDDAIIVLAVAHARRNPEHLLERASENPRDP